MARIPQDFQTVRSEGGLLPPDLLRRVVNREKGLGVAEKDYGLVHSERLDNYIAATWERLHHRWSDFRGGRQASGADTGATNRQWTLPLLEALGYGELRTGASQRVGDDTYPISRLWEASPIHLIGHNVDLDLRAAGVPGAAKTSPHGLVQGFLNRSPEHLWGMVSNGRQLRVLRDSQTLSRQSYLEFDLEGMFSGEAYSDFVLFWLVSHSSHFRPDKTGRAESCWLEKWTKDAEKQGTRALVELRKGVETALEVLGKGFVDHPANGPLRDKLRNEPQAAHELHGALLRVVYRMIFLFVVEDRTVDGRSLLHPSGSTDADAIARENYARHYSTVSLRQLASKIKGGHHCDLWERFQIVAKALSGDPSHVLIRKSLALPRLGEFLWDPSSTAILTDVKLSNHDLLETVRGLAFIRQDKVLRQVDYRNLGTEELGGVYESLLALTPEIGSGGQSFKYVKQVGNERKTSGSYFTPLSLVQRLLDTALDPVIRQKTADKPPHEIPDVILGMRVCDPAVGSGHFLIGAAHRLARHLARARAVADGEGEPAPLLYRQALRDVIRRCLYGVDVNPMTVELCRVGLWLESMEPGKPLVFLEHHIRNGNSIAGILDAETLADGIPDRAYECLIGDDRQTCRGLVNLNKRIPFAVGDLFREGSLAPKPIQDAIKEINYRQEDTVEEVKDKRIAWKRLQERPDITNLREKANLYTAAFFAEKTPANLKHVPLSEDIHRVERFSERSGVSKYANQLAKEHRFFHWPVEFPDVMKQGGFDAVLGNPPWEYLKLVESEFFGTRRSEIAEAPTKIARVRLIARLMASDASQEDKVLHEEYRIAKRSLEAQVLFARSSGRFPLTAHGDINTYALFAELSYLLQDKEGRTGIIVQTGIATQKTTSIFFQEVTKKMRLVSLEDFENREPLFQDVDSRMCFCLLVLGACPDDPECVFFAKKVEHLDIPERRFTISLQDLRNINPNTHTMPRFRSRSDAELTKRIHAAHPVLVNEVDQAARNPWGFRASPMFHMSGDSGLFTGIPEVGRIADDSHVIHRVDRDGLRWTPVYEGKMFHQFDHRWATWEDGKFRNVTESDKQDCTRETLPRYWVLDREVVGRIRCGIGKNKEWMMGLRQIGGGTNERTVIASILPLAGAGNSLTLLHIASNLPVKLCATLLGNLNSLVLDYIARQKIDSPTLSLHYVKQLPVIPPEAYSQDVIKEIVSRVVELTYTSRVVREFATDLGYQGPPFRWCADRRTRLRAELDAIYAHLYGLSRDDLQFILDPSSRFGPDFPSETFRVLKEREMAEYGEYRTQRVVLEAWDSMFCG